MKQVFLFTILLLHGFLPAVSQSCMSFLANIRNYDTLDWAQIDADCRGISGNGFANACDFGIFAYRHNRKETGEKMLLHCAEKGISLERLKGYINDSSIINWAAEKAFSVVYDSVFSVYSLKIKRNNEYSLLEKLYNIDQVARIEYKKVMEKEAFFAYLKTTDSLNYIILKRSFFKQPALYRESLIGTDGSYYLYMLLFHNLRHVSGQEFSEIKKVLHEMTCNGHFSANYYALIIDERMKTQGDVDFPMYNFHNIRTDAAKTAWIDENRKALGLKFL